MLWASFKKQKKKADKHEKRKKKKYITQKNKYNKLRIKVESRTHYKNGAALKSLMSKKIQIKH